uniref:WAP domain-containing protein n=2 Tax=Magallana gigas TaxID=29159 RepID=A0A8W8LL43_MAGGI|nr:whey acidic protein [Crassostrea gigas]|eukprot:XP_011440605.1 PREDICTED: whey acidic protein isoform X1 [Crassostrea gigas]
MIFIILPAILAMSAISGVDCRFLSCNLNCPAGTKCVLQRSTCEYPPCKRYPVCMEVNPTYEMNHIPAELSRPGRCPVPTTPGTCITQCQNDAMCPNNEICCYNGCGFTCSGHQNKPGTCPRYLRNENLCGMDCSSDSDCPGVEKCCMTACGSTCSRPCYYYLFNTANQAAGVRSAFWSLPYICRQL